MRLSERVLTRFVATLAANILRTGLSFVAGILIARGLGAADYGNLNFLLGSFAAINLILDLGSSPAFYTLIARRKRGPRFFSLYLLWTLGVQFCGMLLILGLFLPSSLVQRIWLGHDRNIVLLAFAVSFVLTQIWTMVSQLGEAVRKTVIVQSAAVVQALVHLVLIVGLLHFHLLSVSTILWILIAEFVLLALILGPWMLRANLAPSDVEESWSSVLKEFAVYCRPMVIYGFVGFVYQFADRWLLQKFGGAKQQGFFSIGQQFATISLLATTSILNVLWKEVAEEKAEPGRSLALYNSIRRALYFLAAWLSCGVIPYTRELLALTVGADYSGATLATALMLFYPIHQSLGQIQGTYLLAIGNTRAHAAIGMFSMLTSIPVAYFVTAPPTAFIPGLGLGATGVVIKMVSLQLLSVGLQTFVLHRIGAGPLDFVYQFGLVAALLGLAWACKFVAVYLTHATIASIIAGGLLYAIISGLVIVRIPDMIGLQGRRLVYS
ncbi:MAG TPA: oligosaccharide flippase family protein [Thermoanaerobaculia bacterium]|nr:oligosaccharide flippase family protein [Thermoanaerobaculia bacterium]